MSLSWAEERRNGKRLWDTLPRCTFLIEEKVLSTGVVRSLHIILTRAEARAEIKRNILAKAVTHRLYSQRTAAYVTLNPNISMNLPTFSLKWARVLRDLLLIWGHTATTMPNDRGQRIPLALREEGPATAVRDVRLLIAGFRRCCYLHTKIMSSVWPCVVKNHPVWSFVVNKHSCLKLFSKKQTCIFEAKQACAMHFLQLRYYFQSSSTSTTMLFIYQEHT